MKNSLRRLLAVFMAAFLLAGALPAITAPALALENGSLSTAYEDGPGDLGGENQSAGGEPDFPLPPVPVPVPTPVPGSPGAPPTADGGRPFAYVIATGLALGEFGEELWCALLVLDNGDTVVVNISNGMAGSGIPEYVVDADSTDPDRIVTYRVDDSGRYTLFPLSPDYAVTPHEGAFQASQVNPRLSWAPNDYIMNANTLFIIRTGVSDYSYTTYVDFRATPNMSGSDIRGIVVQSGIMANVVYVESPTIGVALPDLIFLGVDVGPENKVIEQDLCYYLAPEAYWNGIEVPDGLKLDKEYKLGLYAGLTIGADEIASLGDPVARQTARVVYDGIIRIYDGYFAGGYVRSPDIAVYTFETDGGYLELADSSFLPTVEGTWLTFYMMIGAWPEIAVMYIANEVDPILKDEYLSEIYPVFPVGFNFRFEHGDTLDITGFLVMGVYVGADNKYSEIELTGFTVNPPLGTVLRCDSEVEATGYSVQIRYEEYSPIFGLIERTCDFWLAVLPCGHTAGEAGEATTPATCTEPGQMTFKCAKCGAALRTEPIAALGHAPGDRDVALDPTCTEKGAWEVRCAVCGDVLELGEIAALGHEWGDGKVTTPAIVGKAGVRTFTCARCGETRTEDIPALPSQVTGPGLQAAPTPTPTPTPTPIPVEIEDEGPPLDEAPGPFEDVAPDAWYHDNVMYVYRQGLMNGTNDSPALFSPDLPTTRGMIVTILYRFSDSPGAGDLPNPFDDVEEGAWYADAVKWAAENGIVSGYGGGKFGPKDNITREQLAVILDNFAGFAGLDLPPDNEYPGFADDGAISDYAKGAVERLYEAGVVGGKEGNAFDPRGSATRAEVAAMLARLIAAVAE